MALSLSLSCGQILRQAAVRSWFGINFNHVSYLSTPKRIIVKTAAQHRLSPYTVYFQEEFKRLWDNDPGRNVTEYAVTIANSWKNLSSEDKLVYEEKSALDSEQKRNAYDQLSEDEKAQLLAQKQMKLDKRYKQAVKKMLKESGKPSSPITAKIYFIRDLVSRNEFPKIMKGSYELIQQKFDALSAEEKERFQMMAQEDRDRYEREMVEWVNKMKDEGKEQFVAKAHIKKYLSPQQ